VQTVLTRCRIPEEPPVRQFEPMLRWPEPHWIGLHEIVLRWWCQIEQVDGHWLWQGSCTKDGYGYFSTFNTTIAHRFGFWMKHGYLPRRGQSETAHQCVHRNCVNPDCLLDQTHWRNCQDRARP
jgi:hypothetical protein